MSWVHAVLDVPAADHAAAAQFWGQVLTWPLGGPWPDHPELRSFESPPSDPYVHLQQVGGAAGVHLDLESPAPGSLVESAVALGAAVTGESDRWTTLRSPGGLAFCVLPAASHESLVAPTLPDGHRTRLVQVCIDSPQEAVTAEVAFWQALLGGRWVPSDDRDFVDKWHDDEGSPLQLLFQRLHETEGPVRAHLDLGTDDRDKELARLRDLGAGDIGPGRGWHALRDPAGLPFCITDNSPEHTRHRDFGP